MSTTTAVRFPGGSLKCLRGEVSFRVEDPAGPIAARLRAAARPGSVQRSVEGVMVPLAREATEFCFMDAFEQTEAAPDALARPTIGASARAALALDAARFMLHTSAQAPGGIIAPSLLRWHRAEGAWRWLWLPLPEAPLAAWFASDEAAWAWGTREILLSKPAARPLQSIVALMQHLLLGAAFSAPLSKIERFDRVLRARVGCTQRFARELCAAMPAALAPQAEGVVALVEPMCRGGRPRVIRELADRLAALEPERIAAAFEAAGDRERAATIRDARAVLAEAPPPVAAPVADCLDPLGALLAGGDPRASALARRGAQGDGEAALELLDRLPPAEAARAGARLAPLCAHLARTTLGDPSRARTYLSAPDAAAGAMARACLLVVKARLDLDDRRFDAAADAGRGACAAAAGMAVAAREIVYVRAFALLEHGVARLAAILADRTLDWLHAAFDALAEAATLADDANAHALRDEACLWLAQLGTIASSSSGARAEAVRLGTEALLSALGYTGARGEAPRPFPDYDPEMLWAAISRGDNVPHPPRKEGFSP